MQRFVAHYRTAEAYCAYELLHRSMEPSPGSPAIYPATLFAAACFLLSRLLQVSLTPRKYADCCVQGPNLRPSVTYSCV